MIENLDKLDNEALQAEELLALQADLVAMGFDHPEMMPDIGAEGWPKEHTDALDDGELAKVLAVFQLCSEFAGVWRPHTIVSEEYFEDHCSNYASDQYGIQPSDPLWDCMDWEKWARLCANDFKKVETEIGTFMVSSN